MGSEPGAGIVLYIIVCGLLLLALTIFVYALPTVRNMERDLPSYEAIAISAKDDAESESQPALGVA